MKTNPFHIVFIGSGNLATHLSQALQRSGHDIVQVYSKTMEHASSLANKLQCKATDNIQDIVTDADIYIFSVKDDALSSLIKSITSHLSPLSSQLPHLSSHLSPLSSPLFLHTAGSVPMSVFEGYCDNGGVLYPMQTFSKSRDVDFREIPCFIEAMNDKTLTVLQTLCGGISDNVVECDSERRKYLHLAAVFACNLTNHCYRLCEQVLEEQGLDFNFFLPLINETAKKVSEMSPRDAQTGPMVRYDQTIMSKQLSLIRKPLTKEIYSLMARSIHDDYMA